MPTCGRRRRTYRAPRAVAGAGHAPVDSGQGIGRARRGLEQMARL